MIKDENNNKFLFFYLMKKQCFQKSVTNKHFMIFFINHPSTKDREQRDGFKKPRVKRWIEEKKIIIPFLNRNKRLERRELNVFY